MVQGLCAIADNSVRRVPESTFSRDETMPVSAKKMTQQNLLKLEELLARGKAAGGMNIEEVDGFFTALNCAPRPLLPATYLPLMLGRAEDGAFWGTVEDLSALVDLLAEFNVCKIGEMIEKSNTPELQLRPNASGEVTGNDWAAGFMRCVGLDSSNWLPLLGDVEHRGKLVSIMALAHENDPDPALRTFEEPVTPERRVTLLESLRNAIPEIHAFMQAHKTSQPMPVDRSLKRSAPKVGRNDPCPCGSGLKAKRCGCGHPATT